MTQSRVFHRGERSIQELAGKQHIAEQHSSMIKPQVHANAIEFLRSQYIIWLAVQDEQQHLWAFALSGQPGFIDTEDGTTFSLQWSCMHATPAEWINLIQAGRQLGCLAIDFVSRRRLRINGIIKENNPTQCIVAVQQSYPNCPKYINQYDLLESENSSGFIFMTAGSDLDEIVIEHIAESDTAFVASQGLNGADLSHRGGKKGFLKKHGASAIIVPEYKGNNMFNTLGNFMINPKVGMMIIDFNKRHFLQLSGHVELRTTAAYDEGSGFETGWSWLLHLKQWRLYRIK